LRIGSGACVTVGATGFGASTGGGVAHDTSKNASAVSDAPDIGRRNLSVPGLMFLFNCSAPEVVYLNIGGATTSAVKQVAC
jgi:hypothetical protein